ncbi:MAG: hypothetical protein K2X90_02385 [Candidatus Babeliaceae bacterium]|nr:hypothetical protein [Candidatus Babeliaceae bacterium]
MDMNNSDMAVGAVAPDAVPIAQTSSTQGWLDAIKERLSNQEPWAIELVVFGLGGFVAGFLLKNFGRMALIVLAVALAVVVALHYTHVYDMPLEKLQAVLGISDLNTFQDLINAKVAWCQNHPVALVSALVGLLVGWKVG